MAKLHATFITMSKEPMASMLKSSILGRAERNELLSTRIESILENVNSHHEVDDTPYGGGPGELMKIDVIAPLINKALMHHADRPRDKKRVLLMDPAGTPFSQEHAERLGAYEELIFISGRYEGIDARIHYYVDEALSLGDFVMSSGDLAALAIFDTTARLVEGVLGNKNSIIHESHRGGRLESSHYTRPLSYEGHEVPPVYHKGNHALIARARMVEGLRKTCEKRSDLLEKYPLSDEEKALLHEHAGIEHYPWQKNS